MAPDAHPSSSGAELAKPETSAGCSRTGSTESCPAPPSLSLVSVMLDLITRIFPPYEFNPLNVNPLREAVTTVDFEVLRSPDCPIKLFLCASNVHTGKIKVFERDTICVDRVMPSAGLPQLFQAVKIDGEHCRVGGYMGNPVIFPLIYNCTSREITLIRINPLSRHQVPRSCRESQPHKRDQLYRRAQILFSSGQIGSSHDDLTEPNTGNDYLCGSRTAGRKRLAMSHQLARGGSTLSAVRVGSIPSWRIRQ
jgi:predicted acylesterase/phospholipase RssA